MSDPKPQPGHAFPKITLPQLGGGQMVLGQPADGATWALVVVYRGKHCPLCHRYLTGCAAIAERLAAIGVTVQVVSGDGEEKARAIVEETGLEVPVGYGLSIPQMRELGLYISDPRSPQETDRPFPEPGVFAVNPDGKLQIVDISNAPFARPDLDALTRGWEFIIDKGYPILGTHAA